MDYFEVSLLETTFLAFPTAGEFSNILWLYPPLFADQTTILGRKHQNSSEFQSYNMLCHKLCHINAKNDSFYPPILNFDQTGHTTMYPYRTALAQSHSAVPAVVITPQGWLRKGPGRAQIQKACHVRLGPSISIHFWGPRMELDIYSHQQTHG